MTDISLDMRQAATIYNTMVEPIVVGSDGDGNPVYQVTPASAMAQLISLPPYLTESKSEIHTAHRTAAAAFFRKLAEALEPKHTNAVTPTSAKHSPGPWKFGEKLSSFDMQQWFGPGEGEFMVIDSPAHGGLAFVVWRMEDDAESPEKEANAHAIVAAPDLLDALEYALPYLEVCVPNARNGFNTDCSADVNCVDRARAAIAKARGVQS